MLHIYMNGAPFNEAAQVFGGDWGYLLLNVSLAQNNVK